MINIVHWNCSYKSPKYCHAYNCQAIICLIVHNIIRPLHRCHPQTLGKLDIFFFADNTKQFCKCSRLRLWFTDVLFLSHTLPVAHCVAMFFHWHLDVVCVFVMPVFSTASMFFFESNWRMTNWRIMWIIPMKSLSLMHVFGCKSMFVKRMCLVWMTHGKMKQTLVGEATGDSFFVEMKLWWKYGHCYAQSVMRSRFWFTMLWFHLSKLHCFSHGIFACYCMDFSSLGQWDDEISIVDKKLRPIAFVFDHFLNSISLWIIHAQELYLFCAHCRFRSRYTKREHWKKHSKFCTLGIPHTQYKVPFLDLPHIKWKWIIKNSQSTVLHCYSVM